MPDTLRLPDDAQGIADAATILRDGGLVAFPTETVYGLGADAKNGKAVAAIYQAKGRPSFNPLIIHVASVEMARRYAVLDGQAEQLAQAFWPGPLTLVLPLLPGGGLSELVTAGLGTVGVRFPAHDLAQQLLHATDRPVAAPSANLSGKVSPTSPDHVLAGLKGRISAVLDGGVCDVGVESTIVGFEGGATLLRPGGVPTEAIEACLGQSLSRFEPGAAPNAPGQLLSHYAPEASIRLNASERREGERLLGFGPVDADLNLSPGGDLHEAAANLFGFLHKLSGSAPIAVSPIPDHGLGRAINDRLRRAAAPRAKPGSETVG